MSHGSIAFLIAPSHSPLGEATPGCVLASEGVFL